jgi:S1-C subfamily serine protease
VGILTDRYGDRDTGLPAAIGISTLKGIMEALSSGIDVAYLGIQGQNATASVAAAYDMPIGIYITKVITDSPAYVAGLKAGDILVSCDSTELTTMQKLQSFLESYSTGDVVVLQVYRAGQEEYIKMDFSVTLGSR